MKARIDVNQINSSSRHYIDLHWSTSKYLKNDNSVVSKKLREQIRTSLKDFFEKIILSEYNDIDVIFEDEVVKL